MARVPSFEQPAASSDRFVVMSLSRSGSTAVYRLLGLCAGVNLAYEPALGESWPRQESFRRYCDNAFPGYRGVKHVWDPNGWPFTNEPHLSTKDNLARSADWVDVNASLANCFSKVLVLRRRNQLARIVSDLLGQQTGLWGHDPEHTHSTRESEIYRHQLLLTNLQPLDPGFVEWYLRHAIGWEEQILSRIVSPLRVVDFEELFGEEVSIDERLDRIAAIGAWLGVRIPVDDDRARAILDPGSKFNDRTTYRCIPNYDELVSRFGTIEDPPATNAGVQEPRIAMPRLRDFDEAI